MPQILSTPEGEERSASGRTFSTSCDNSEAAGVGAGAVCDAIGASLPSEALVCGFLDAGATDAVATVCCPGVPGVFAGTLSGLLADGFTPAFFPIGVKAVTVTLVPEVPRGTEGTALADDSCIPGADVSAVAPLSKRSWMAPFHLVGRATCSAGQPSIVHGVPDDLHRRHCFVNATSFSTPPTCLMGQRHCFLS